MLARLKAWAAALKHQVLVLWFGSRDPRTPWHVKLLAGLIVAYALSPIDLIPDFIPILGFLDEIILLPAAIWMVLKLVPRQVLVDSRVRAQTWLDAHQSQPRNWIAAAAVVLIWILALWALWVWVVRPRLAPT